ncbi:MAG: DUF1638 domain-containing protein [Chloroflexota bacterium]
MMRLLLISCEVLARQVYYVAAFSPHVIDIQLVDKGLHSEPDVLRADLQERLDALEAGEYDAVLLGYGLCSNATAHLVCEHTKMILPRAHDCITLYLGSKEWYGKEFRTHPGTYWYTPDYMERGGERDDRVSLGTGSDDEEMAEVYEEYVEKYGRDNADYLMEVMGAWKQHYDRAAYIETSEIDLPDYTDKVQEIAERRGWNFQRLAGSLILLEGLLQGRWDEERFLIVPPGRAIVPTYDGQVVGHAKVGGMR